MNLPPAFSGLRHEWLEEHLTTMKTKQTNKKTFVALVPLTSVNICTTKRTEQMHPPQQLIQEDVWK